MYISDVTGSLAYAILGFVVGVLLISFILNNSDECDTNVVPFIEKTVVNNYTCNCPECPEIDCTKETIKKIEEVKILKEELR